MGGNNMERQLINAPRSNIIPICFGKYLEVPVASDTKQNILLHKLLKPRFRGAIIYPNQLLGEELFINTLFIDQTQFQKYNLAKDEKNTRITLENGRDINLVFDNDSLKRIFLYSPNYHSSIGELHLIGTNLPNILKLEELVYKSGKESKFEVKYWWNSKGELYGIYEKITFFEPEVSRESHVLKLYIRNSEIINGKELREESFNYQENLLSNSKFYYDGNEITEDKFSRILNNSIFRN